MCTTLNPTIEWSGSTLYRSVAARASAVAKNPAASKTPIRAESCLMLPPRVVGGRGGSRTAPSLGARQVDKVAASRRRVKTPHEPVYGGRGSRESPIPPSAGKREE